MSYIHDEDEYITLDVTGFYRNMLINTIFYDYKLIVPFNNKLNIEPSNLYYIECPLNDDLLNLVPENEYDRTYCILY